MNGANAVLGIQLKDSGVPEIQRKASFNFQTRLLNKAGRMGWGALFKGGIKGSVVKKY